MKSIHGSSSICPICVSKDRNLYILEDGLRYITISLDIFDKESSKQAVCWECYANLRKISKFKQTALQAQIILKKNIVAEIQNASLSTLKRTTQTDVIKVTSEETVEDTEEAKLSLNLPSQLSPLVPEYPLPSESLLTQQPPLSVPPSLLQLSLGSLHTRLTSPSLPSPSPPSLLQLSLGSLQTHLRSPSLPSPSLTSECSILQNIIPSPKPLLLPCGTGCSVPSQIAPPRPKSLLLTQSLLPPSLLLPLQPSLPQQSSSLLQPLSPRPAKSPQRSQMSLRPKPLPLPPLLQSSPSNVKSNMKLTKRKMSKIATKPIYILVDKTKTAERISLPRNLRRSATLTKPNTRTYIGFVADERMINNETKLKVVNFSKKTPKIEIQGKINNHFQKTNLAKKNNNFRKTKKPLEMKKTFEETIIISDSESDDLLSGNFSDADKETIIISDSESDDLLSGNFSDADKETIIISDSESDDLLSGNFSDADKSVYVSSNDESGSENVEWLEDSAQESDSDVEFISNDPLAIDIVQSIKKNKQDKNKKSNQREIVNNNLRSPIKSSFKTNTNISDNKCVQENKKRTFDFPLQLGPLTNPKKIKNQRGEYNNFDERGFVTNNLTSPKNSSSKTNNPQNITTPNKHKNDKTTESILLLSNTKNIGGVESLTHNQETFTIFQISEYMADNAKKQGTVVKILPKILGTSSKNLHDPDEKNELVLNHLEQKKDSMLHGGKKFASCLKDDAIVSRVLVKNSSSPVSYSVYNSNNTKCYNNILNHNIVSYDNNKVSYIQNGIGKTINGQDLNKTQETKIVTDTNVTSQLQYDKIEHNLCLTQNNTHVEPLDRAIYINETLVKANEKPYQASDKELVMKPQLHVSKIGGIPDKNIFVIGLDQQYAAVDKDSQGQLHENHGAENNTSTNETLHVQVTQYKIRHDGVCSSKKDKKVDDNILSRNITPDFQKCIGKDINGQVSNETRKTENETNVTPGIHNLDKMCHDQLYVTQSVELLDRGFLINENRQKCIEEPRKDMMTLVAKPQLHVTKITAGPLYKNSSTISEIQLDVMGTGQQHLITDRDSLSSNKTHEVHNNTGTIIHNSHNITGKDPPFVEEKLNSQGLKKTEGMENNKEIYIILQKQATHEKVGNEQIFIAQNYTHIEPLDREKLTKVEPQQSRDYCQVLSKDFKAKPQLYVNKITADMPWKNDLNTKNISEIPSIPLEPVKTADLDSLKAFYTVFLDHCYCKSVLWKRSLRVARKKYNQCQRSKLKRKVKNQEEIKDMHANKVLVDKDSNVTAADAAYVGKSACSKRNEEYNICNIEVEYDAEERNKKNMNYSLGLCQTTQEEIETSEEKSEITDTASEIDDFEHIESYYNYENPIDNKCTEPIINCELTDTNYNYVVPVENDAAPIPDSQKSFLCANIDQNLIKEKETSHEHDNPTEWDKNFGAILTVCFPYPDSLITECDEDNINELNDDKVNKIFDDLKDNPEHRNLEDNLLEPLYYVDWEDETYKHVTNDNKNDSNETQVYMSAERHMGKRSVIRQSTKSKGCREKMSLEQEKNNRQKYISDKKAILTESNSDSEIISTVNIPYKPSSSITASNVNNMSLVSEVTNLKDLIDCTVKSSEGAKYNIEDKDPKDNFDQNLCFAEKIGESYSVLINDNKNINHNHHSAKLMQIKVNNDINKKQALRPNIKKKKRRKNKSLKRRRKIATQNKSKLNSDFLLAFKRLNMDIENNDKINRQVNDNYMLNSVVQSKSNNIPYKKRKRTNSNDSAENSMQKSAINEKSSLHHDVRSKPNYKPKQKRSKRDNQNSKRDKNITVGNNTSRYILDFGNPNPNESNNENDSNQNVNNLNFTNCITNHLQVTLDNVENCQMTDKLKAKNKYINEPTISVDGEHSVKKKTENFLPEREINSLNTDQINYNNFTDQVDIEELLPSPIIIFKTNGVTRLHNNGTDTEKIELDTSENKITPIDFIENNKVITLDDLEEDFCCDEVEKIESNVEIPTHMWNGKKFNKSLYILEIVDENEAMKIREKYKSDSHFEKAIHKCYLCVKDFYKKQNLFHHLKWHETPGPFVCNSCSLGFSSQTVLKTHIAKHFRCYKCCWCDMKYTSIVPLKEHVSRSHPLIYNDLFHKYTVGCDRCGKRFFEKYLLLSHTCSGNSERKIRPRKRIPKKPLHFVLDTPERNSSKNLNSLENNTCSAEKNSCSTENNSCSTENNTCLRENNLCSTENNLSSTENNLSSTGNYLSSTENNLCSTENNLSSTGNNSCLAENSLFSAESDVCSTANLEPTRKSSRYDLRKRKPCLVPTPNDRTGALSTQGIGEIVAKVKKPKRKVKIDACVKENNSYVTKNIACLAKDNLSSIGNNSCVTELNASLTANNSCVTELNVSLTANNSCVTELNASLTANNSCVTELNASLTGNNSCVTELNASLTGNNSCVTELNASLTANNSCVTELNASLTANNSWVTEQNASWTAKKSCVTELKTNLTEKNFCSTENNSFVTELNASLPENNLCSVENNLCVTENTSCSATDVSLENEFN